MAVVAQAAELELAAELALALPAEPVAAEDAELAGEQLAWDLAWEGAAPA